MWETRRTGSDFFFSLAGVGSGLGASALGASALGASALGASGLITTGLAAFGLVWSDIIYSVLDTDPEGSAASRPSFNHFINSS